MSDAPTDARRAERASKLLVIVLAGIFLFGMLGFVLAVVDARHEDGGVPAPPSLPAIEIRPDVPAEPAAAEPRFLVAMVEPALVPSPVLAALAEPGTSPDPAASPAAEVSPSLEPSAQTEPASEPIVLADVVTPIVPVISFWSRRDGLSRQDIVSALETGEMRGVKRVFIDDGIADALAAELDVEFHPDVRRGDATRIRRAVASGSLGLVPATAVAPSMRMLKISGRSLIGTERVKDVTDWPLRINQQLPEGEGWDQADTWVLVAGGDSFTDRGVYDTIVHQGKGVDYPFDGGTAKVTGHGCCDPVFNDNIVPRYVLTGNKGAVRKLFKGAELAIANHEQPVTESATFHSGGLRFSGKPALTKVFTRAGIDWLSLANNHIKDSGSDGIRDTRRILRQNGIAFGGAGRDLDQARQISYLEAGDTRLAIIPCLDIVKSYWAGPDSSGATPCLDRYLVPDIKEAKRKADFVVVFPHWGVEYTRQPLPSMRKHAARWVKAGADLILGGHSHVAGSIEDIDGSPVLYSLGNLIFDQHWSTNTMESALLEATFHGGQLIELRLRPYIIHDTSQPNFLDPSKGEGRRLIKSIRAASADWLDW